MDGKSLVLNSISCKGVKCFTLFQKPTVYAVVYIAGGSDGRKSKQQKQETTADHEGGENPEWDQTMQFDLDRIDIQDLFLEFRFKAQGNIFLGDKLIGKSRVLMADLVEGQTPGVVRHVSYQVQSPDGKPNGVLSFSYRLNLPRMEIQAPPPVDPVITPTPLYDYHPPFSALPASATGKNLYPPLPLPEIEPTDYFLYNNKPSSQNVDNYYTPLPPPPPPLPPAVEYYHSSDRSVYPPALTPDPGYVSGGFSANRDYNPRSLASLPPPLPLPAPAFGTNYPPPPPPAYSCPLPSGYTYPPTQDSCSYCNCR